MATPLPELRRGRIVWATVRDRNQVAKRRPVIVITETALIKPGEPIQVMPITTTFPEPPPDACVELPWHPQGKAATRLRKRSAAVLNWLDEILPEDVLEYAGDVPPRVMVEILSRLDDAHT